MLTSRLRLVSLLGVSAAVILTSCTAITDNRVVKVIHCEGATDGSPCGNEIDDGVARICVANQCEVQGCGDGFLDTTVGEVCDDGNTTPYDGCEPVTCVFSCEADANCDDGKICTGTETCDLATHACVPGTSIPCTPSDECHASTCDDASGGTCIETLVDDTDHDLHASTAAHPSCGTDCNDTDADIYVGNVEVCGDGKDNNCVNGTTDETTTDWYADCDADGYALAAAKKVSGACAKPATTAASTGCSNDSGDWTYRNPVASVMERDCADNTADAHPDPTGMTVTYHGSPIPGTTSYNWDCDSEIEMWDPGCQGQFCLYCFFFPGGGCSSGSWWRDSPIPACGNYAYREYCGDESMDATCSSDTYNQQTCK